MLNVCQAQNDGRKELAIYEAVSCFLKQILGNQPAWKCPVLSIWGISSEPFETL